MIGRGDLLEGFYVFKVYQLSQLSLSDVSLLKCSPNHLCCNTQLLNKVIVVVWHARLGHISDQRLYALKDHLHICSNKFPYVPNCYVCPLAKQKKKFMFSVT